MKMHICQEIKREWSRISWKVSNLITQTKYFPFIATIMLKLTALALDNILIHDTISENIMPYAETWNILRVSSVQLITYDIYGKITDGKVIPEMKIEV